MQVPLIPSTVDRYVMSKYPAIPPLLQLDDEQYILKLVEQYVIDAFPTGALPRPPHIPPIWLADEEIIEP